MRYFTNLIIYLKISFSIITWGFPPLKIRTKPKTHREHGGLMHNCIKKEFRRRKDLILIAASRNNSTAILNSAWVHRFNCRERAAQQRDERSAIRQIRNWNSTLIARIQDVPEAPDVPPTADFTTNFLPIHFCGIFLQNFCHYPIHTFVSNHRR